MSAQTERRCEIALSLQTVFERVTGASIGLGRVGPDLSQPVRLVGIPAASARYSKALASKRSTTSFKNSPRSGSVWMMSPWPVASFSSNPSAALFQSST